MYIFFLPKYCSEMNPIELEWQHIKKDGFGLHHLYLFHYGHDRARSAQR
ncbi:MAG: hypothetical protein AAF242_14720 [Bacteroidota bacterium]